MGEASQVDVILPSSVSTSTISAHGEVGGSTPAVDGVFGSADFLDIGAVRRRWAIGRWAPASASPPLARMPAILSLRRSTRRSSFYLCGLISRFPEALANGRTLDAYIVQPRHQDLAKVEKFGALPENLIVKAASGTTLARDDNARIAVPDRDEPARRLARALQRLEASHNER